MSRFCAPALFVLILATACVETVDGDEEAGEEGPVPAFVVEDEHGNLLDDRGNMIEENEDVAPLIGALGRRRACVYDGRNKTGRASCWYAPSGYGACRKIPEITVPDYCGAAGCVRDNSVESVWVYADTYGATARLYKGHDLEAFSWPFSVASGNRYANLPIMENTASSMRICNYSR